MIFLEKYNYFDTAVIILSCDHGEYNGAHGLIGKGSMIYEGGLEYNLFHILS